MPDSKYKEIFFGGKHRVLSALSIDVISLISGYELDHSSILSLNGERICDMFVLIDSQATIHLSATHFGILTNHGWDADALVNTPQLISNRTLPITKYIEMAVVLCDQQAINYAHFQANVLAPLNKLIRNFPGLSHVSVIVNDPLDDFQIQLVENCDNLVNLRFIPARMNPISVKRYIRLNSPRRYYSDYERIALLLDQLWNSDRHQRIDTSDSNPPFVYIERMSSNNGSGNRRVVNTEDRDHFLRKHGYIMLSVENYTATQLINIFRNAKEVIGVEGAALFYAIHMPSDSLLIELHHPSRWDRQFTCITAVRQIMHVRIPCVTPYSQGEEELLRSRGVMDFQMPLVCDFRNMEHIILRYRQSQT